MDLGGTPSGDYIIIIQCRWLPIGFRNNVTFLIPEVLSPTALSPNNSRSFLYTVLALPCGGERGRAISSLRLSCCVQSHQHTGGSFFKPPWYVHMCFLSTQKS